MTGEGILFCFSMLFLALYLLGSCKPQNQNHKGKRISHETNLSPKSKPCKLLKPLSKKPRPKPKLSATVSRLRWKQQTPRNCLPVAISCAGLLFSPPALIPSPLRKSSERKSTKPLPNRFLPGAFLSVHKKSPLSDRLPSHRQRAI